MTPNEHEHEQDDGGGAISWEEHNLQVPERCRPRKRLVEMTGAEFGEACADMVKAIERGKDRTGE